MSLLYRKMMWEQNLRKQRLRQRYRPKKEKITAWDVPFIMLAIVGSIYLLIRMPLTLVVLGVFSLCFLAAYQLTLALPILERTLKKRIRFWHIVGLVIGLTAAITLFMPPAQAIFLSGLEQFMIDIASEAGEAAGGEGIEEDTITLIFNIIRGVFLLLVGAAALFSYNQAQQGNDWRPIVTQIGLAFGIVIAIDVITYLFIGDGSGTTAQSFISSLG